MVTVIVDGVAAVHMLPVLAGKKLVLRFGRAGGKAQRVAMIESLHFLQEHDIRIERAQPVAQLVDHHPAVEMRQALVDIERHHAQAGHHRAGSSKSSAKRRSIRSGSSKWRRPTNAVAW